MLRLCYVRRVKTISQRELRNDSAEIIRGLSRGETYRITNRGEPVGVLAPAERSALDDATLRQGSQDMVFPAGQTAAESVGDVLRELRTER